MNEKDFFNFTDDLCALLLGLYLSELIFPLGDETEGFDYLVEPSTDLDPDFCDEEI